ncbi:hypothetical protein [Pontibacter sp. G13]|uniref:hypothetical protein n=1 Tax=Pontibacter sp. G13 TaxID=3074898 RepID=UPI00288BA68C|nr:hypothetical protein [Pontibacter sp. G13]WNJ18301.1 hypothetical protein RJD25_25900 [Pontibacter sp. G13]
MFSAIGEITIMLLVAGGIGFLFAWLYWRSKYRAAQVEASQAKEALEQMESEKRQWDSGSDALEEQLKSEQAEFETYKLSAEKAQADKQQELDELAKELEAQKTQAAQVSQSHSDTQQNQSEEIQKLRAQLVEFQSAKQEAEKQSAEMTQENESLKAQVTQATQSSSEAEADQFREIETLRAQLAEAESSKQSALEQAEKALAEKKEAYARLKKEVDGAERKHKSYYKIIDGVKYKAATLMMADEAVAGRGDGRISMEDARQLFDTISDGKQYTDVEKATLKYIRTHYKWTEEADELFRQEVRIWAANDHELEED